MSISKLKVKTNSLPSSRLAVELEIPSNQCKTYYENSLSELSRSLNLPGFRKGKVPKAVIIQQIGIKRIQASALEKLLAGSWKQAIDQEDIQALCEPELKGGFETLLENFDPNQTLSFVLETDIAPSPKLKVTKGMTAEAEIVKYDSKKVEELIEQSRKQLATLIPVENRSAIKGDMAVVSFQGKFTDDGSDIPGGSNDSMEIELEEGKMIPGFIQGIIGMSIGEEKIVQCKFPDNYQQEEAQGRNAEFTIKLNELKKHELPNLDDDFAKQTSNKSNMSELRKDLETRLQEDVKRRQTRNRQESLLNALVEQMEVELPETLINQEIRNLIEQTARNFAEQGIDVKSTFTQELVSSLMESSRPEAEKNLKQSLALNALAKEENIKVDEKELEEKIKEVHLEVKSQGKKIDPKKLKEIVSNDLLEEKLLMWLEENNTIVEKKSTSKKEKKPDDNEKAKKPKSKTNSSTKETSK